MRLTPSQHPTATGSPPRQPARQLLPLRGSVLIIVLWVALGLVTLTLYFANSMSFELRAADNRAAALAADQAIDGAARYLSYVLSTLATNGVLPDLTAYQYAAVPVGEATFWLLGRDTNNWQAGPHFPTFGLVDEGSKLNLNIATAAMLEQLPRMTPELAAAIVDWRDADDEVSASGAEIQTYALLRPAYACKNANFDTTDELRWVFGATLELLYGEDANLNGTLEPSENDGELSAPYDNRDGRLDPGLLEYVTVYSREPNTRSDGSDRININPVNTAQLTALLQTNLSSARLNPVLAQLGLAGGAPAGGGGRGGAGGAAAAAAATPSFASPLELCVRGGLTTEEFALVANDLTATNSSYLDGRININTASAAVLACVPGIGSEKAQAVVDYRRSNPTALTSVAWLRDALADDAAAIRAGPYVTTQAFQFSADVAAVGPYGRGYRRTRFIFDTSDGTPKIVHRQDLGHLGWALGQEVRQAWLLAQQSR